MNESKLWLERVNPRFERNLISFVGGRTLIHEEWPKPESIAAIRVKVPQSGLRGPPRDQKLAESPLDDFTV